MPRRAPDAGRGSQRGMGGTLTHPIIALLALAACSTPQPKPPLPAAPPLPEAGPGDTYIPSIPIGYDAFRAWDQWPRLRIGTRTTMRSTYDRAGGNEGADASHFLRVTA